MITQITNDEEYNKALDRLDEIFDAASNTPEGEELRKLASLIEAYEEEHFPEDDE